MDDFLEAYFGDLDYIKENINIKKKDKHEEKIRFSSDFKIYEVNPDELKSKKNNQSGRKT